MRLGRTPAARAWHLGLLRMDAAHGTTHKVHGRQKVHGGQAQANGSERTSKLVMSASASADLPRSHAVLCHMFAPYPPPGPHPGGALLYTDRTDTHRTRHRHTPHRLCSAPRVLTQHRQRQDKKAGNGKARSQARSGSRCLLRQRGGEGGDTGGDRAPCRTCPRTAPAACVGMCLQRSTRDTATHPHAMLRPRSMPRTPLNERAHSLQAGVCKARKARRGGNLVLLALVRTQAPATAVLAPILVLAVLHAKQAFRLGHPAATRCQALAAARCPTLQVCILHTDNATHRLQESAREPASCLPARPDRASIRAGDRGTQMHARHQRHR